MNMWTYLIAYLDPLPSNFIAYSECLEGEKSCSWHILCGSCVSDLLKLDVFSPPVEFRGSKLDPLSFNKFCVHIHVNKIFERNSSLEYYNTTCIEKTKHTS